MTEHIVMKRATAESTAVRGATSSNVEYSNAVVSYEWLDLPRPRAHTVVRSHTTHEIKKTRPGQASGRHRDNLLSLALRVCVYATRGDTAHTSAVYVHQLWPHTSAFLLYAPLFLMYFSHTCPDHPATGPVKCIHTYTHTTHTTAHIHT